MDTPQTPTEARDVLRKIMCQCPHQENDPDCHLCSMRDMVEPEREHWLADLTDDEAMRLCIKHNRCFWGKLGDR